MSPLPLCYIHPPLCERHNLLVRRIATTRRRGSFAYYNITSQAGISNPRVSRNRTSIFQIPITPPPHQRPRILIFTFTLSSILAVIYRYNPVLGEFFRCRYDYPDGSQGFYIAEQGKHCPPHPFLSLSTLPLPLASLPPCLPNHMDHTDSHCVPETARKLGMAVSQKPNHQSPKHYPYLPHLPLPLLPNIPICFAPPLILLYVNIHYS